MSDFVGDLHTTIRGFAKHIKKGIKGQFGNYRIKATSKAPHSKVDSYRSLHEQRNQRAESLIWTHKYNNEPEPEPEPEIQPEDDSPPHKSSCTSGVKSETVDDFTGHKHGQDADGSFAQQSDKDFDHSFSAKKGHPQKDDYENYDRLSLHSQSRGSSDANDAVSPAASPSNIGLSTDTAVYYDRSPDDLNPRGKSDTPVREHELTTITSTKGNSTESGFHLRIQKDTQSVSRHLPHTKRLKTDSRVAAEADVRLNEVIIPTDVCEMNEYEEIPEITINDDYIQAEIEDWVNFMRILSNEKHNDAPNTCTEDTEAKKSVDNTDSVREYPTGGRRDIENLVGAGTSHQPGASEDYSDIGEFRSVLDAVNLNALEDLALNVRKHLILDKGEELQDLTCEACDDPVWGSFKMVFFLTFSDGVKWIARFPQYGTDPSKLQQEKMNCEYQTIRYIRAKTDLKVPEVYFWTTEPGAIGCAFALMSHIEGKSLDSCWKSPNFTDAHRLRAVGDVAREMAKLYCLQFETTGMLRFNGEHEFTHVDHEINPIFVFGDVCEGGRILQSFLSTQHWFQHLSKVSRKDTRSRLQFNRLCRRTNQRHGTTVRQVIKRLKSNMKKMCRTLEEPPWDNHLRTVLRSVPICMQSAPLTLSLSDSDFQNIHVNPDTGKLLGSLTSITFAWHPHSPVVRHFRPSSCATTIVRDMMRRPQLAGRMKSSIGLISVVNIKKAFKPHS